MSSIICLPLTFEGREFGDFHLRLDGMFVVRTRISHGTSLVTTDHVPQSSSYPSTGDRSHCYVGPHLSCLLCLKGSESRDGGGLRDSVTELTQ